MEEGRHQGAREKRANGAMSRKEGIAGVGRDGEGRCENKTNMW